MVFAKVTVLVVIFAVASANPFSKSPLEEMRSLCAGQDTLACIKYKFMSFLDTVFHKDSFKVGNVEVVRNEYRSNEVESRGDKNFEDNVLEYIQSHDVTFKLPLGAAVTVESRNLDNDELNFSFKLSENGEARKSKLKKLILPIVAFVLLKFSIMIPFFIGIFGLKSWNSLQLSFFSFIISVALSVFQLCKKLATDSAHPQIAAHGPWEAAYSGHYKARSFDDVPVADAETQQMAYNAYN